MALAAVKVDRSDPSFAEATLEAIVLPSIDYVAVDHI